MSISLYKYSFLCTLLLVFLLSTRSQANRLDIQISTFMLDVTGEGSSITFMPGIGIGYDFRNPASRPGWSWVPILLVANYLRENTMYSFLFTALVARYRYSFYQLCIDGNIGGGLLAAFSSYISHEDVD